jgi:hypothetical protein
MFIIRTIVPTSDILVAADEYEIRQDTNGRGFLVFYGSVKTDIRAIFPNNQWQAFKITKFQCAEFAKFFETIPEYEKGSFNQIVQDHLKKVKSDIEQNVGGAYI